MAGAGAADDASGQASGRWAAPRLEGAVCVVTGATRGVGKGVALALGDCGATVYATGRSTRAQPGAISGTVEETAEAVAARGGTGIAAVTDHTDDAQVEALFARVRAEQGRLDVLVANAWGGYEGWQSPEAFTAPFWEQPPERWERMVAAGLRAHYTTARAAAPLLLEGRGGLAVLTGGWGASDLASVYLGNALYDVVKAATDRLVVVMAEELRPHGVAVVGVYPGFTRTEAVVAAFAAQGAEPPPEAHSPELVGRAVACVAADPERLALSGAGAQAADYAQRYGFTDVDGRRVDRFEFPPDARIERPHVLPPA